MNIFAMIGWLGASLYLCGHCYLCYKKAWNHKLYFGLNIFAAILVTVSSLIHASWQAVTINAFWAVVSIYRYCGHDLRVFPYGQKIFIRIICVFFVLIIITNLYEPKFIFPLLGWSSVFVFSAAYLLFSIGQMTALSYFLWSAYAATAILPQLWIDGNSAVFTLEVVWSAVSLLGAIKVLWLNFKQITTKHCPSRR